MARGLHGGVVVLIGILIVLALLLPPEVTTFAEGAGLPNPPALKWSVWFPMQTSPGYRVLAIPLPVPVHGGGLALLAWFRTQEGLYTPMVRLLDGADGAAIHEVLGLPSMFPLAAMLLNTTGSGAPQDLVAGGMDEIVDIDLQEGRVKWDWRPPAPDGQPLAGPPAIVPGPSPQLLALEWGGSMHGLDPATGVARWTLPGRGNGWQISAPAVAVLDGARVVAATESQYWNDTWVVTMPARLRLVDLDARQARWAVPLSGVPFAAPMFVPGDPGGDPLVVFFDLNDTAAPPATQRAFAVSARTGDIRWNATWYGGFHGDPSNPSASALVDTPLGPTIFAPGEAESVLRVGTRDGTAAEVRTACNTTGPAWSGLSRLFPLDFAGDGMPELLGVAAGGRVCVFSVPDLDVLWNYNTSRRNLLDPAVGDIDRDGMPELVVVSEDGHVTAFDIDLIGKPCCTGLVFVGLGIAGAAVAVLMAWVVLRRRRRRRTEASTAGRTPSADPGALRPDAKGKL